MYNGDFLGLGGYINSAVGSNLFDSYVDQKRTELNSYAPLDVIVNQSFRDGCGVLLQNCGIGALRPNVVVMGFKEDWKEESDATVGEGVGVGREMRDQLSAQSINQSLAHSLAHSLRPHRNQPQLMDYVGVIQDIFSMRMGCLVVRNAQLLNFDAAPDRSGTIDVWWYVVTCSPTLVPAPYIRPSASPRSR